MARSREGLLSRIWASRLSYVFVAPFVFVFTLFIVIPIVAAILLSFTHFNAIERPRFIGWDHYSYILSQDLIFLQHVLPNTIKFAVIVGPGGFSFAFILAWIIAQLPNALRIWFALAFYAPSLAGSIALQMIWQPLLTGDRIGYLNHILLQLGVIGEPRLWVTDPAYLMNAMIAVTLWSSMGVGFLALMAGILNVDPTMYEAARIDGIKSRLQEVWHITIPIMKPQMLFAAVMAIVGAFRGGTIGALLSGQNPTPQYAGHMFESHIQDYGFIRFEMGYASALSVTLLLIIYALNKLSWRLFGTKGDE